MPASQPPPLWLFPVESTPWESARHRAAPLQSAVARGCGATSGLGPQFARPPERSIPGQPNAVPRHQLAGTSDSDDACCAGTLRAEVTPSSSSPSLSMGSPSLPHHRLHTERTGTTTHSSEPIVVQYRCCTMCCCSTTRPYSSTM